MKPNNRVVELINAKIAENQQVGFNDPNEWCVPPHKFAGNSRRRYIGASQIGGSCRRQPWYQFHWCIPQIDFDPRVLRLFDRGHREEQRMIGYLRLIDVHVEEYDPATIPSLWHHPESDDYLALLPHEITDDIASACLDVSGTFHEWIARGRGIEIPEPRQFGYIDLDGHHAGHCDGRARGIPDYHLWGLTPDEWALLQFKTHNDRSFQDTSNRGVKVGKPDHYSQVQRYMHKIGMRLCLYMAVNKNDDDLYCEYIPIDPDHDIRLTVRAKESIYETKPPPRISTSPSWYECRWCDARPQSHYGAPHSKNCRSCDQSMPITDGRWGCQRWQKVIPLDFEEVGCGYWHQRDD